MTKTAWNSHQKSTTMKQNAGGLGDRKRKISKSHPSLQKELMNDHITDWKKKLQFFITDLTQQNRTRQRQRERQKTNRSRKQNNKLCTCSTLNFCTFLCRHWGPLPHVSVFIWKLRFFFFTSLDYRQHVAGENGHWKRIFSKKTLSRVETSEKAGFSFTCGRTKTEVFEYDDVIHHILISMTHVQ